VLGRYRARYPTTGPVTSFIARPGPALLDLSK
jgi:hypothetical protein